MMTSGGHRYICWSDRRSPLCITLVTSGRDGTVGVVKSISLVSPSHESQSPRVCVGPADSPFGGVGHEGG